MAISKVVYGNNTLIDLTNDTISADKLLSGYTAHNAKGESVTGTVVYATIYNGNTDPSASIGVNGDIYLKVVG